MQQPGAASAFIEGKPAGGGAPPSALLAAILTAGLVAVILGVLRPGYWINDDLKIAWLLAGYPGSGGPSPYPLHSNVLVGLLLVPFFRYAGSLNWFSIFMALTDGLAGAGLLFVALSGIRHRRVRLVACLVLELAVALLILEISYTISAFLASLAGVCLVWSSGQHPKPSRREAIAGIALMLLGSLIRLQMLAIALVIALAPLLLASIRLRRFFLVLTAAGLAVFGAYGLGRLYMRTAPDWNSFIAYTDVRQSIHDSHRLFNVHGQIRRVGWTPNDQELFARWFFPDADLYSYDHLRYLEDHVSPYSQDFGATLAAWLPSILGGRNTAYLVSIVGLLVSASALALDIRRNLALLAATLGALAINAGFAVVYKNPDYVQACTLAASLMISILLLSPELEQGLVLLKAGPRRNPVRLNLALAGSTTLAIGAVLLLGTLLSTSRTNALRREEYARIRAELLAMQQDGILPPRALVVSPAHGLPYEWSNPFELDRPVPAYFDTGWITFSPPYTETLDAFDVEALPDAFLNRDDVFLMTQQDFTPFLSRYYEEHYSLPVTFEALYRMPNTYGWPEYDGIYLFRVRQAG